MKVLHTILFALLCFCSVEASAYSDKNLLQQAADIQRHKAALVPQQKWVNYPLYTDRAGGDKLFADTKQEYIKRGEQQLN